MGVKNEPIQNGICDGTFSYDFMPGLDRELRSDNGRMMVMSPFHNIK
jgi:hypothetical protein